jgi:hypothetical protein
MMSIGPRNMAECQSDGAHLMEITDMLRKEVSGSHAD